MPYGQILEFVVALLLISSAPEQASSHLAPLTICILWCVKALIWYAACFVILRRQVKDKGFARPDLWEWVALLPFILDIYFLDFGAFFFKVAAMAGIESLREILGVILFFGYLSVVWAAAARLGNRPGPLVSRTVCSRLRLLLPVVLPYFFLIIFIDILGKLPISLLRHWLDSDYSQLVLLVIFMLFFLFVVPPLVVRLWTCHPLPRSELRQKIEDILAKQGMTFSDIMVWSTGEVMACTAAVLGIIPGFRFILITPCLLTYLLPKEIEAVIAHEVEHVRRKHVLWYVLLLAVYSAVLFRLASPVFAWLLSSPLGFKLLFVVSRWPSSIAALLAALPLGLIFILYFRFLMGFFMRNFEREADMAVFRIHGHPLFLIDALKKVALLSGIDPYKPNWHHYSIAERIKFLTDAFSDRGLIRKQERLLYWTRAAYMAVCCILILLPSVLPVNTWKSAAHDNIVRMYIQELINGPERTPQWYLLIGELAFERKQYRESELAYRKLLAMQPENPEALNNLAWLYARSPVAEFRRPDEALKLAKKAARLKPVPHVLDTLAEAYFVNGLKEQAVAVERKALAMAPKNREYYEQQLKKFQEALRQNMK